MKLEYNPNYPGVDYLRAAARKRIPGFAFDYVDGGCNEEVSLIRNTEEIRQVRLDPVYLKPFDVPDLQVELFGHRYSAPFGVAPVGLQGLVWPGAPKILARAAFEQNIPFILSTVTTEDIETIGQITEGRAWFQLYYPAETSITDDLLQRLKSAGYSVLVLLADVPAFGFRPKEIKNGLAMPPRMTFRNICQIMGRPQWAWRTLCYGKPGFASLKKYMERGMNMQHLGQFMNRTFNGRLTSEKIAYIRDRWHGKLVVKGITSEWDAEQVLKLGADGIIVSNHGGRQLDAAESAVQSLEKIARRFKDQTTLMMDSGIRSGPDIARVLACGASAVFLGRAFMYGVAALGEKGGVHTAALLRKQLVQVLEQLNCPQLSQLADHRLSVPR